MSGVVQYADKAKKSIELYEKKSISVLLGLIARCNAHLYFWLF
jgi:hypothetical protein